MNESRSVQAERQNLIWLAVGGNPRSGTTALGEALNRSNFVRLFHEYDTKTFFDALAAFFAEQKRHQAYPDFDQYAGLMPLAERDSAAIAAAIFQSVFDITTPVIGTKFPGNHLWLSGPLPDGVVRKDIHISRNPLHTIYSVVEKMAREGTAQQFAQDVERAVVHWMNAWNHAVDRFGSDDFYHLFYEDLDNHHDEIADEIARFLGIACDFSLKSMQSRNRKDIVTALSDQGLIEYLRPILRLFDNQEWPEQARERLYKGVMTGYPLGPDGLIDLRDGENGWKYDELSHHLDLRLGGGFRCHAEITLHGLLIDACPVRRTTWIIRGHGRV